VSGVLYLQDNHNICKESCYTCINVDLIHHDREELSNDLVVVLVTPLVSSNSKFSSYNYHYKQEFRKLMHINIKRCIQGH